MRHRGLSFPCIQVFMGFRNRFQTRNGAARTISLSAIRVGNCRQGTSALWIAWWGHVSCHLQVRLLCVSICSLFVKHIRLPHDGGFCAVRARSKLQHALVRVFRRRRVCLLDGTSSLRQRSAQWIHRTLLEPRFEPSLQGSLEPLVQRLGLGLGRRRSRCGKRRRGLRCLLGRVSEVRKRGLGGRRRGVLLAGLSHGCASGDCLWQRLMLIMRPPRRHTRRTSRVRVLRRPPAFILTRLLSFSTARC
mmetsp:Transcript_15403/g.29711  ORF Transcript_15403/g.29711 Transcript_15403/m.29711 type:complete len:247 (+) Transcript_15403:502-1242(+)